MTAEILKRTGLSKLFIVMVLGFIALVILGVVFIMLFQNPVTPPAKQTLTVWGVWDDTSDLREIIDGYQFLHPYVTVNYVKVRFEEYEDMLIKAWAKNTGPDIYMLPHSWVNKFRSDEFIAPMPVATNVYYYTTKKVLFQEQTEITPATEPSLTPARIKSDFVDVVYGDVVFNDQIYALPLAMDSLSMYYNRTLLGYARVAEPPVTWDEFTGVVTRIAVLDAEDNIIRAGAALGTYDNIPRASDIVTLLMMQNGTNMSDGKGVYFNTASGSDGTYFPGQEALRFYTDFAKNSKSVYTWNSTMPNALDSFADGRLAFFLGYRYQDEEIRSKASGIDYAIAPVPQVNAQTPISVANYWLYTVARQSPRSELAWNFVQYAASNQQVRPYLANTGQVSALRAVINEQLQDPELAVFAQQALTARSWYHGRSPEEADEYFGIMVETVAAGTAGIKDAIDLAANKIQQGY
ncbi:MAG: extracellular solute-binding protein [Patescibacteria group bacterium]